MVTVEWRVALVGLLMYFPSKFLHRLQRMVIQPPIYMYTTVLTCELYMFYSSISVYPVMPYSIFIYYLWKLSEESIHVFIYLSAFSLKNILLEQEGRPL